VAERWGRRWVAIDLSRVPLALARQRLLTATFPWYALKDDSRGPAGGLVYKRKQNTRGEEIGGIVPHITLKSIANNEPPAEEVLVDRPEIDKAITRVTGPFCVEAMMPTPVDWEGDGQEDSGTAELHGEFEERMLEVLRKSPLLRLDGNRTVRLFNVRPPAKTLSLSAEALVDLSVVRGPLSVEPSDTAASRQPRVGRNRNGDHQQRTTDAGQRTTAPVAFVFGPENGAVSEKLVFEAAREAHAKSYTHLYVIGFAIQPNARTLVEKCAEVVGVAATYVQATPDLLMGDLLKNMRSSQIFSVCGLPEIRVVRCPAPAGAAKKRKSSEAKASAAEAADRFQVELVGLDVFDPVTMDVDGRAGSDVPAWFLDTDYNDLCFHVSQAFFPRTAAWDNLKKALRGTYDDSVWQHLAGTTSVPFEPGQHRRVAVKVIDDRGNELMVVKSLEEAE